jgi:all-trans-retinol dehydrogenase (NAD+)
MTGLQETKLLCEKNGVLSNDIQIFSCDVSSKNSILQGAVKARRAYGPVTILINNAGVVSGLNILELSDSMIDKTLQINTISHLHTIKEFLPDMIAQKRGHIVTIASMAGLNGVPGLSDYCASKFGAVAIDETVRLELQSKGLDKYVKTTCICPYFINTGMF